MDIRQHSSPIRNHGPIDGGPGENGARRSFAVVGIGVSAGCPEAVRELLAAVPGDAGAAYVVVQHAEQTHRLAAEMLESASTMPVVAVGARARLRPGLVFLLPADAEFTLRGDVLERLPGSNQLPIDSFFKALAHERRALARGVVLSGSGPDAADGLLAIKRQGGLSFAQDPLTARYDGMPRHAIGTHSVDYVLAPAEIARALSAGGPRRAGHGKLPERASQWHARRRAPRRSQGELQIAQLRRELANSRTREHAVIAQHRSSLEALTIANAELSAANQELSSMNEELQSMNEELNAGREELLATTEELQRQNAALDQSSDDLLNVLASVEIPTVIVDAERRVSRYLPSATGLVQLIPNDVGRPLRELRLRVLAPDLDDWIREVIASQAPAEFEVQGMDGRWQRLQIRPYRTHSNEVGGAVVSLVDIDALKRAIADARTARDRLALVFESVPLPIAALDQELRVRAANRSFYEYFRLTREQAVGRPFSELGAPSAPAELGAQLSQALVEGEAFRDFEVEYATARGRKFVLLDGCRLPPVVGERSLLLMLQDVTARRKREQEQTRLRSERVQRLLNEAGRLLLSESLDPRLPLDKLAHSVVPEVADLCMIDLVDASDTIAAAAVAHVGDDDPHLVDSLAASPDDVVGQVVRGGRPVIERELDPGALSAHGARAALWRSLGARSYMCVPMQGRSDVLGALTLVRVRADAQYAADDLAIAEGLGQRAGIAIENAKLYRAANDAIRLRDEFLGIAAHELRTPLTALILQLENLEVIMRGDQPHTIASTDKIERALRHSRRLARLIDSLLVVSRLMSGRFELQLADADLAEITRDAVERMRPYAERAGCELVLHADAPVHGSWDALRIEQVLSNLLSNAFRYAAGSKVTVRLWADEQHAYLRVADRGPGIAKERQARIFERYEVAGKRMTSGLGLGLYVIRQIVEAHGGSVHVDAELGAGSSFLVELPRVAAPTGAATGLRTESS